MNNKVIIISIGVLGILLFGFFLGGKANQDAFGATDSLAQCLTEKGVTMYGAFWCSHCKNQKLLFGKSWKYVDYVECSTPNGQEQTPECVTAGIQSYPTWEFADGTRKTGEVRLQDLAETAGCLFDPTVQE